MAAEQGYVEAQGKLCFMYAKGRGVEQDYAEAVRWSRLAAEQGFVEGLLLLASCYGNGEGVPQDFIQAQMWLNLATERLSTERSCELM